MHFAGIRVVDHEELAKKLGTPAAAEVLLLVIAKECESSPRKWQEAKDLGIPWLEKRWTSLRALMEEYNEAVAEDLNSDKEDATLPDSSESNSPDDNSLLQPLLCAPYLGPPPGLTACASAAQTAFTQKEPHLDKTTFAQQELEVSLMGHDVGIRS